MLRLRTLISTIVVKEVEAFKGRQAERKLARLMSREQIEQSAQRGKIDPGQNDLSQSVDVDQAITTALQAFEDGLYYVFIDNVQQQGLDDEVVVNTNSRVVFLRLTALAGG